MEIRKILYPTDFSDESTAALSMAESIARGNGASILIAYVLEPGSAHGAGMAGAYGTFPEDVERSKEMLEEIHLSDSQIPVEHRLLQGTAASSLCELAEQEENIDLVVMATHGRGGLSRLLMGSVAEAVVRQARCPVLTLNASGKFVEQDS